MSYMTMNMSVRRISACDRNDTEWRQARSGGWSRADLRWERLSEAAIGSLQTGWRFRATCLFHIAYWQARLAFDRNDRRIATSLINLGIVAGKNDAKAKRRFSHARLLWQAAAGDADHMVVKPRTRSSLFHLRMEARHRETYLANARRRVKRMIEETEETLGALEGSPCTPVHRHFSRWRGERPVVFDDMRKILGACLLIVDVRDARVVTLYKM